jgi:hypothetical protein
VTPGKIGVIPAARVTAGFAEAIGTGMQSLVGFYSTSANGAFDNDQMCDCFNPNATLKAPIAGVYQVDAGIEWAPNSSGSRFLTIGVDGGCCLGATWVPAAGGGRPTIENISDLVTLQAGQHVYVQVIQDSGGTLNASDTAGTFLAMHWVSR